MPAAFAADDLTDEVWAVTVSVLTLVTDASQRESGANHGSGRLENVYHLHTTNTGVYESISYLPADVAEQLRLEVSILLGDGMVWVAVEPASAAIDDAGDDRSHGALPPAFFLHHMEERSYLQNVPAGAGKSKGATTAVLRLTVAARHLTKGHGM